MNSSGHPFGDPEILTVSDKQTAAQDATVLLNEMTRRDQAGDTDNDPDAEYEILGLEFESVAAGTLVLHTDAAAAGPVSRVYAFPANHRSGFIPMRVRIGKNKKLRYTTTGTNPTVGLTVQYRKRRYSSARAV